MDNQQVQMEIIKLIIFDYCTEKEKFTSHAVGNRSRITLKKRKRNYSRSKFELDLLDYQAVIESQIKNERYPNPSPNTFCFKNGAKFNVDVIVEKNINKELQNAGYGCARYIKIENIDSWLRKLEEKLFITELAIEDQNNSLKNWALIGLRLASLSEGNALEVYTANRSKKADQNSRKSSSGMSIDFERASWVNNVQVSFQRQSNPVLSYCPTHMDLFRAFKLAFAYGEKLPNYSVFQELELKLKIKAMSEDSLKTSFSRGLKQFNSFNDWMMGPKPNNHG